MRKTLSNKGVAALKPRAKSYSEPDPQLVGHYIRVHPTGRKVFVAVSPNPATGKQVWFTIGSADAMGIDEAREQARAALNRVRDGLSAVEAKGDTFGLVTANWLRRHVERNGLRTRREIARVLEKQILPAWRNREFVAIKRSDVNALLDRIEENHGARAADYALTIVSNICNWFSVQADDYRSPIVRKMRRQDPHKQRRERILTDDEIRAVWQAAENDKTSFGGIVRLCLLTAQRREKVTSMRWADLSIDGEWTIEKRHREKGTGGSLLLPPAALDIVRAQHRQGENQYVFPGRGEGQFSGYSKSKARLDAKLPADMPGWVLHDLRRTARTLMSRAGVNSDHAERVLGHAIVGVEGVYDRHSYREEKADALRRLAGLIESIVNPRSGNVRPIRRKSGS